MNIPLCFEVIDDDRYKYRLAKGYIQQVDIAIDLSIFTAYIGLDSSGVLDLREGYVWDGPSGPAIDTASFLRASLVHDALYQLMREGELSISYRKQADQIMRQIALDDRMPPWRARYAYRAVRWFAGRAALPPM